MCSELAPKNEPAPRRYRIALTCAWALFSASIAAARPGPAVQAPEWQVLEPKSLDSAASARFEVLDDQSVLVSRVKDDWNAIELELPLPPGRFTALRIEALEHESLPNGGPGRSDDGRFKVGELELGWSDGRKKAQAEPVAVSWAAGAVPHGGVPQHAVDHDQSTAWGPSGDSGPLQGTFEFVTPVGSERDSTLYVRIEELHQPRAGLGRFRLSVTESESPLEESPLKRGWGAVSERIPGAIERGVDGLLRWQELDGSWGYHTDRYPAGATALAVYTLLKCGLTPEHPSVRRGMAWLLESEPVQTYPLSCAIMALCAYGPESHMETLERWVTRLRSYQKGGFAYPYNPDIIDLSCGQYAALALRAAAKAGLDIPKKTWSSLAASTLRHIHKDRSKGGPTTGGREAQGYGYRVGDEATGSMTTAGVSILAICSEQGDPKSSWDRGIDSGLGWLADNFSVTRNPLRSHDENPTRHGKDEWLFYYLYGVERVGGLLDLDRLGPWDWYRHGALYLLERQSEDGLWGGLPGHAKGDKWQVDTCFALLFLQRATAPSTGGGDRNPRAQGKLDPELDVSLRLIQDYPLRVWIAGYGSALRSSLGIGDEERIEARAVEYQLVDPEGRVVQVLERLEGGEDVRFPAQLRVPLAGSHRLRAVVEVLMPDYDAPQAPGAVRKFESPTLEFDTAFHDHPALLTYAKLPFENLLPEGEPGVSVSSQLNDGASGAFAVDRRASTGWLCANDDPNPGMLISLDKPQRADVLVLTPFIPPPSDPGRQPARATRVRVHINGGPPLEQDLRPEGFVTEIRLEEPKRVSRIDIELLDVECPEGRRAVGLSSVQLLLRS
jgi:hypothetical protein